MGESPGSVKNRNSILAADYETVSITVPYTNAETRGGSKGFTICQRAQAGMWQDYDLLTLVIRLQILG